VVGRVSQAVPSKEAKALNMHMSEAADVSPSTSYEMFHELLQGRQPGSVTQARVHRGTARTVRQSAARSVAGEGSSMAARRAAKPAAAGTHGATHMQTRGGMATSTSAKPAVKVSTLASAGRNGAATGRQSTAAAAIGRLGPDGRFGERSSTAARPAAQSAAAGAGGDVPNFLKSLIRTQTRGGMATSTSAKAAAKVSTVASGARNRVSLAAMPPPKNGAQKPTWR